MRRITVLGAGNGAQAMAGHLAWQGHRVSLFEHPDFSQKIADINALGNRITLTNALEITGQLHMAVTDIAAALKDAEIVFFIAPTFAQRPIFELALPHFEDGQTVVIIPGNFGSLALRKMMKDKVVKTHLFFAETDTLPYACRLIENGRVNVWGLKEYVSMGTLPGSQFETVWNNLGDVFPVAVRKLPNALAPGFSNANMVIHCATVLMNAGRVENQRGEFRFYTDGMTPAVCSVQEAVDAERVSVAQAFGLSLPSTYEQLKGMYGLKGNSLHEVLAENPAYGQHGNDAPKNMKHRYLSEDIPYLLTPLSLFGRMAGRPTPVADSLILLAGTINKEDYRSVGWSIENLGLENLDHTALLKLVSEEI